MSSVVFAAGKRVPGRNRAGIGLIFCGLLAGGCSSGIERFNSTSFGSGYGTVAQAQAPAVRNGTAANAPYWEDARRASYQQQPQLNSGVQLASASPNSQNGYLQVARSDLPPVSQGQGQQGSSGRTRFADGYGAYNQPPLTDGTYTGPRVYTPYDPPRDGAPPPPPERGDPRYDRSGDYRDPPPASNFYRTPAEPRVYEPRRDDGARTYEPVPDGAYEPRPEYRQGPDRREPGARGSEHYPEERAPRYGEGGFAPSSFAPKAGGGNGTVVKVAQGDTLYGLATRYGVTAAMIMRANHLSSRVIRPGQDLLIPGAGSAGSPQVQNAEARTEAPVCTGGRCHVIKPGETINAIARAYRIPEKRILEANNLQGEHALRAGQTIVIPLNEAPVAAASAPVAPERQDAASAPPNSGPASLAASPSGPALAAATPGDGQRNTAGAAVSGQLAGTSGQIKAVPAVKNLAPEASCDAALSNPLPRTGQTFRRPVEGLIIAQFGPQRDGTVNEGVTISVPKGTPIKAAENGVVAYVGDELPGFGNLILIRHADEYVTAYAHADEILVKKCDIVKRGQIVGKAGATGDASQPELHFEIRKNSKPVDPAPLMSS
jgi:murein DD-endopeptidase MepM/ murein hydrolase activator NlpD